MRATRSLATEGNSATQERPSTAAAATAHPMTTMRRADPVATSRMRRWRPPGPQLGQDRSAGGSQGSVSKPHVTCPKADLDFQADAGCGGVRLPQALRQGGMFIDPRSLWTTQASLWVGTLAVEPHERGLGGTGGWLDPQELPTNQ